MSEPAGGVRAPFAVALAFAGFAALAICGLGFTSLFTGQDVIATPGLGNIPGIAAMLGTAVVFLIAETFAVRRRSYVDAAIVTGAVVIAYATGLVVGAFFVGVDVARAVAAAGGFLTSWFCVALAAAAAIAAWSGVALVRTRAQRPQWPWEREEDE